MPNYIYNIIQILKLRKDTIYLIYSDSKDVYYDISFKLRSFFWTFYRILEKNVMVSILGGITVFNIDNNKKCCLEAKSVY